NMSDGPLKDWSGWILKKAVPVGRRRRGLERAKAQLVSHDGPLFIFPLQLETDFQIRLHGPPEGLRETLRKTIASFEDYAPADAALIVKLHPLDNGWTPWERLTREAAEAAGVGDRVLWFDGGDLDGMVARCNGVVVVNSTVGLSALRLGAPVVALGKAIYDLPGLTHQGTLDGFWTGGKAPDAEKLSLFLDALSSAIQVPGGFDGSGAKPGAAAMAAKMIAPPPYETGTSRCE
ncbi:MAG: capsular biosynthesis protein, partial [Pseudomonadota bacterium]